MSIEELSSPCVTCLLMFFTGGIKSIDDLIRGSNAKGGGSSSGCAAGEVSGKYRKMSSLATSSEEEK